MQILNFTPHPLSLRKTDGSFLKLSPEVPKEDLPRLETKREGKGEINGLQVVKTTL